MLRFARGLMGLLLATAILGPQPAPAGGDASKQPDPVKEAARYAGEWVISSVETNGQKNGGASDNPFPPGTNLLTIREHRIECWIAILVAGWSEKGTFQIVEIGPRYLKVDVSVVEKSSSDLAKYPDREYLSKEIWRLTDGGKFQRCFPDDPTGKRPESFSTKKGDGLVLMTYEKREK